VYNFTVDELHTYTVSRWSVLVHNVDCFSFKDEAIRTLEEAWARGSSAHTSAVLRLRDGRIVKYISGEFFLDGEKPKFLKNITQKQHPYRFNCAEINCILEALDGSDVNTLTQAQEFFQGSEITTARLKRGSTQTNPVFEMDPPCGPKGCGTILSKLGIKYQGWK
jgi:hypothetical protein